ncbi:hypothetical protein L3X38_036306 [Prunus dulcis]|uniref:Retrovirus-related Pol polyprotein from transposon TNT 1-94-like beta-barrel domain-containing protein n=1 Tax=Prunus dulcis TaxID=3755 RepID=A0AAD4YPM5_PRUDU|nr:hypothetical protein L3X38_036306 [Prunus dulcis]
MSAMYAQASPSQEVWIADSGATNHMTADISALSTPASYPNADTITAANGAGLNIAHIGASILPTPSHVFQLNSVLHVPQLSTGLSSNGLYPMPRPLNHAASPAALLGQKVHFRSLALQTWTSYKLSCATCFGSIYYLYILYKFYHM